VHNKSNGHGFIWKGLVLIFFVFATSVWFKGVDNTYNRPINSDGKAYYAYLPAIFMYGDPTYGFIDDVEKKYYPTDGSHAKDFLNKQPNGTKVNKTFPGLAILYAPFFFLSWLVAWIFGFACDGYSLPFQWGIGLAHAVYLILAARFLWQVMAFVGTTVSNRWWVLLSIIAGTNVWYYVIVDHTVSHVFSFFLCSLLLFLLANGSKQRQAYAVGWMLLVFSLLVIIRPTNALFLLFLPFLFRLLEIDAKSMLKSYFSNPYGWVSIPIALTFFMIPPILWKWQTGYWLVYSYDKEGFDFFHPHFWKFLFSYQKGWLLWSPILVLVITFVSIYLLRKSMLFFLLFLLPLTITVFVFSSWWCWTYGTGFGQRPMIEFLPIFVVPLSLFLEQCQQALAKWFVLSVFVLLSLFQGYQFATGVMIGGNTDAASYWSHFLQWKRDAPSVILERNWKNQGDVSKKMYARLDATHEFSPAAQIRLQDSVDIVIAELCVGGTHSDPNIQLVVSNDNAGFYQTVFLGDYLYDERRIMSFRWDAKLPKGENIKAYVWNGKSESTAHVTYLRLQVFHSN
jgi:hypothetical protein